MPKNYLLTQLKKEEENLVQLFDKANYFVEEGMENLDKIKEKHIILYEDICSSIERIKRLKEKL